MHIHVYTHNAYIVLHTCTFSYRYAVILYYLSSSSSSSSSTISSSSILDGSVRGLLELIEECPPPPPDLPTPTIPLGSLLDDTPDDVTPGVSIVTIIH